MGTGARTAMTTGRRPMPTDPQLMTLVQWLSPAFPVGGFAYSHGLETAIAQGHVQDAATLEEWLEDILRAGSGRSDAIWLWLAHGAVTSADLLALDAEARAFIPARHRLAEADKQGAAFVRTLNAVWALDLPPLLLPLAVGAGAARWDIGVEVVLPLYLQAFVSNLILAAQRLMPLGQTEGQRILSRLGPVCLHVAGQTRGATIADIHSTAFLSDIMAMRHENLQPRVFQS